MITKEILRTQVSLLRDLATAATELRTKLAKELGGEDAMHDILSEVQEGSRTDVDDIIRTLIASTDALDNMPEGTPEDTPYLKYTNTCNMELGMRYTSGEKLASYLSESDFGTYQAGALYYTADESPVDLTMAEIKKGELAEIHGYSKDNKDVDIMVWGNVTDEDYSSKYVIRHADILDVLHENTPVLPL